ncbi:MAG TPA: hypothetical protein EYH48_01280 [Aquifex aeolicus]|uniref:Uncharacterized protein n=1 Tax=Aquifex aeolicus TaxID=63363 RepID=A0A9D1CFE0_AQUAO|nr:hypothetical protein [Aquifex aeolicus]HIQ25956.1 hypothetical protein [Aquifex aeolicus]
MAKVIKWDPEGDKNKSKAQKEEKEKKPQPLTEEDFKRLFKSLKEGLKSLYPSQVEDVLGFYGMGEKNGNRDFLVGIVLWKRYGVEQPYSSTFVALFENSKLQKISFLEAKNNYWDWRVMLQTYKKEFHTEEIFNRFMELARGQFKV